MSTISEFKSNINKYDLMRSNRYYVELNSPTPLAARAEPFVSNLRMIRLMCHSATLPGINISTSPVRSFGEQREIPYEKIYDPLSLTFYVDGEMIVKRLFDAWVSLVQGGDRLFNYPKDYSSEMKVHVYKVDEQSVYSVHLFDCFPKTVGAVQLDYGAREVMKLTVTFSYRYYDTSETMDARATSIGTGATILEDGDNVPVPVDYTDFYNPENLGRMIQTTPEDFMQDPLQFINEGISPFQVGA